MTERHADHPIDAQFLTRWSPRAFAADTMTEAQVMQLLEAARWAPSASNNQPARFAWGLRGEGAFAAILGGLVSFNQAWAKEAAALIVVASKPVVEKNGEVSDNVWHAFDAGAAWMSMALQAQSIGLIAHAMGGFEADKLGPAVGLPAGYVLQVVVALGTHGKADTLPEGLRAGEVLRGRRLVADVSGHGKIPA